MFLKKRILKLKRSQFWILNTIGMGMINMSYSKQSHHLRQAHAFWASCDQAPDALNEIKNQT